MRNTQLLIGIVIAVLIAVVLSIAGPLRVAWHRMAADQGWRLAEYNLGAMYVRGQGAKQDYAEAVNWFRKAADQGVARAQYNLGVMYAHGLGVAQDKAFAFMWLNLASAQGLEVARSARDKLAASMTPDQTAEAQRLAREWKPTR